jgi:hypothetical protein
VAVYVRKTEPHPFHGVNKHWEEYGRKQSRPILRTCASICEEELRKTMNSSVEITGVQMSKSRV